MLHSNGYSTGYSNWFPCTQELLLKHGARLDCRDDEQNTALFWAGHYNVPDMVALLLRSGCDVHAKNCVDKTAAEMDRTGLVANELLWRAVEDGDTREAARLLTHWRASPREAYHSYATPDPKLNLLWSQRLQSYPYASAFSPTRRPSLQAPTPRPTPLHLAINHTGSVEMLLVLLHGLKSYGADSGLSLSAVDHEGLLPVHRAVRFGHVAAARLLLEAGASLENGGSKKRKKSGKLAEENPDLILPNLPRLSPDAPDDGLGLTPLMHAMHVQVYTDITPITHFISLCIPFTHFIHSTHACDARAGPGDAPGARPPPAAGMRCAR
jgi:ankyrin repeat protein